MKQTAKEKEIIEGVGGGDAFTDVEDKIKGNGSTLVMGLSQDSALTRL